MDAPKVSDPGSWVDAISRAHASLSNRVAELELAAPARSAELRDQIAKLARRVGALEERLGMLDQPPTDG